MNKIQIDLGRNSEEVYELLKTRWDEISNDDLRIDVFFTDGFGGLEIRQLVNVVSVMPQSQSNHADGTRSLWNGDGNPRFGRSNIVCGGWLHKSDLIDNSADVLKSLQKIINRSKKHQMKGEAA